MEHKNIEKIDIERSKELFEYEMTEVILMLKGEFAAVSGKDLSCSHIHISDEERNLPREVLSQAQLPPVKMQSPEIPEELAAKITAQKECISQVANPDGYCQVSVAKPNVDLPQIPGVCAGEIPAVTCHIPSVDLPTVATAPKANLGEVSVTPCDPQIPAIPQFDVNVPAVQSQPIHVEVPHVQNFANSPALPDCAAGGQSIPVQVSVSKIPAVSIPPVACQSIGVSIPEIPAFSVPQAATAPAAANPNRDHFTQSAVSASMRSKLDEVRNARIQAPVLDTAVRVSVPVLPDTAVPAVPEVYVERAQGIPVPAVPRCEYSQPSQSVPVMQLSDIEIPAKPDTQKEVNEILAALFN